MMNRTVSENISNKNRATRPAKYLFLISCLLALFACFAQAQTDQTNTRFTQGSVSDSAQMSLGIPLSNYKGRGIDLPVSLSYDANVWNIEALGTVQFTPPGYSCCIKSTVTEAIYSKNATSGWRSSLQLPTIEFPKWDTAYDYKGKAMSYPSAGCFNFRIPEVYVHMPDGSTHTLRKSDQPYASSGSAGSVDMSGDFYAIDGSRVRFNATGADTGTIYMPDGTRYVLAHPTSQIIDRNGNTLTYSESTRQWTDTIGRVIGNPLPATPTVSDTTYTLPGLTGGTYEELEYTFKWRELEDVLTPVGGSSPALRVIASESLPYPTSAPASGNFPETQSLSYERLFQSVVPEDEDENPNYKTFIVGHNQAGGALFNPVVLSEIVLPDGTSYHFTYNVYGQIDKVVYPTGAYDKYTHTGYPASPSYITEYEGDQQPYLQAMRWISSRKQSANGNGSDEVEWTYVNAPGMDGGGNTSVENPDGTLVMIERFGPGDKYNEPGTSKYYYRFGDKDPRVGMTASKTFYSAPVSSVRTMLRRELYAYDAHDSNSTEYSVTCQLGSSSTTKQFPMRRAARLSRQTNITFEGSGSALAQSTAYNYDTTYEMTTGLDETATAVYDFVVLSNSTAQTAAIGAISIGNLLKSNETDHLNGSTYRNANILGFPTVSRAKNSAGTVVALSEKIYDESTYSPGVGRALPTSEKVWYGTGAVSTSSPYLMTRAKYDSYGNLIEATDAKQKVTTTTYDSTYHAFPVGATSPVPDTSGTYGSASAFTTSTTFNTSSGVILSITDMNGQTTTREYNDPLLRQTKVTAPNGRETVMAYGAGTSDATRWVKVRKQLDETRWSEAISWHDGLGRIWKTQETDSHGDIFTETEYDEMGRVKRTTNPYRTGETKQWTTPEYDDLGRTTKITTPDSNYTQFSYALSTSGVIGTSKTAADQAGHKRQGIADALENMVRVVEDPDGQNLTTDYVFDTLGNVRKTTQGGQSRYFMYDSLGRILYTRHPEEDANSNFSGSGYTDSITGNTQWSKKNQYDDNSNLVTTIDAKNTSTTGTYDNMDRLVSRSYSDSTPSITFYYDGKGLGISPPNFSNGKTTRVTSSISDSRYTSFDQMGNLRTSQQITDGRTFDFGYTYNLAGELIEETYPSGRVVKNSLDGEGRLSQVQSKKNGSSGNWTYADAFKYDASGSITKMQLGNGHWETTAYNERHQVVQVGLGKLDNAQDLLKLEFKYNTGSGTDNNGAMREQKITVPTTGGSTGFTATQTYTYDALNRIQSATENISSTQTWKQTFSYDRFGNRRFDTTSGATTTLGSCDPTVCNPTFNTANNRFASGQNYVYDANGSVTSDPAASQFSYDAEHKLKEAKNDEDVNLGKYYYDGKGNRVKKETGTEVVIFVYDASGKLVAEYSTILSNTPQVSYLTTDHLGSPRVITDANGAVKVRKDYMPFGEETFTSQRTTGLGYPSSTVVPSVRQDFTGYEKDGETGLEYAQARYYNPGHGRFTSVDPLASSGSLRDPQSFNRYSYASNSPHKFTDPLGLFKSGLPERSGIEWYITDCEPRHLDDWLGPQDQVKKPPPKKVYIFVSLSSKEIQTGDKTIKPPDFTTLIAKGKENGIDVILYDSNGALADKYLLPVSVKDAFLKAVQDPDVLAVIYVGHGAGDTSVTPFVAAAINVHKDGGADSQIEVDDISGISVKAGTIGIFGCSTEAVGGVFMNSGATNVISVSSGKNGTTSLIGIADAGFAAASAIVGNQPDQAVSAADAALQKIVRKKYGDINSREKLVDKGDKVIKNIPNQ